MLGHPECIWCTIYNQYLQEWSQKLIFLSRAHSLTFDLSLLNSETQFLILVYERHRASKISRYEQKLPSKKGKRHKI